MRLNLQELIQVGINNILIARAQGMELSVSERLLLDQWCRANQADARLKQLVIEEEISYYDELGHDTRKMAPKDTQSESDRGRDNDADVRPALE